MTAKKSENFVLGVKCRKWNVTRMGNILVKRKAANPSSRRRLTRWTTCRTDISSIYTVAGEEKDKS